MRPRQLFYKLVLLWKFEGNWFSQTVSWDASSSLECQMRTQILWDKEDQRKPVTIPTKKPNLDTCETSRKDKDCWL